MPSPITTTALIASPGILSSASGCALIMLARVRSTHQRVRIPRASFRRVSGGHAPSNTAQSPQAEDQTPAPIARPPRQDPAATRTSSPGSTLAPARRAVSSDLCRHTERCAQLHYIRDDAIPLLQTLHGDACVVRRDLEFAGTRVPATLFTSTGIFPILPTDAFCLDDIAITEPIVRHIHELVGDRITVKVILFGPYDDEPARPHFDRHGRLVCVAVAGLRELRLFLAGHRGEGLSIDARSQLAGARPHWTPPKHLEPLRPPFKHAN